MFNKNLFILLTLLFFTFALFGCATTHDKGAGVVLSAKKIQERDFKYREGTKVGATVGGIAGATSGAVAGGFVGLMLGAFTTSAITSTLIATTFGGAVLGTIVVGGAGVAAGAGLGYVVDVARPNQGVYQFVVQPDNQRDTMMITQYSTLIPKDSRVRIIERDNILYIKKE